jgi:Flp pilus assembly protein TadG
MVSWAGRMRRRDPEAERGAVLVEFAIVLPLLLGLALGIISFGGWYNAKLSMATAAREAARYGATLPTSGYASTNAWMDAVANSATGAAGSQMAVGVSGRYVCVALINSSGTSARIDSGGSVSYSTGTPCITDSFGTESRVQVVLRRTGSIQAVLFSSPVTLTGTAVARFEASS